MLDIKSTAMESPSADASFEPYGRLLRMLMPSLAGVIVHDGFANLVWASDEWDLADEPGFVAIWPGFVFSCDGAVDRVEGDLPVPGVTAEDRQVTAGFEKSPDLIPHWLRPIFVVAHA